MQLQKHNPTSSSTRHKIRICKNNLLKNNKLIKSLNKFLKKSNGRSTQTGRITVRHKGSGCKNLIRKLPEAKEKQQVITLGSTYDPLRSSFISLKFDVKTKKFTYDVALKNEFPGMLSESNQKGNDLRIGFRAQLSKIPAGSIVSLIGENKKTKLPQYVKSAGNSARIVNKTLEATFIKLPSGKIKRFKNETTAKIGAVANEKHFLQVLGNAGINRRKNKRPTTRGIAMNPVDHPHGGRTNGGRPSVSPWGLLAKCKFKLKKRKRHE